MIAVQGLSTKVFNKFIVLHENTLISYSLDLLARVALGEADSKMLHSSMERIAKEDGSVLFAKLAVVSQRMLCACFCFYFQQHVHFTCSSDVCVKKIPVFISEYPCGGGHGYI